MPSTAAVQQAEAFIKLGFRLGFGGAMTYAGSRRIRQLAAELPLSSIVLETDAPDIPPAWGGRAAQRSGQPARALPRCWLRCGGCRWMR